MPQRRTVSVSLVLVISVLCPAACGLRGAAAQGSTAPDCCGGQRPGHGGPIDPSPTRSQAPDSCFCSSHGVTLVEPFALHFAFTPVLFTEVAPQNDPGPLHLSLGFHQALFVEPPNIDHIVPLLI